MPSKKRKLCMSKSSREARLRSRPTGKSSFGAKNFAGKTFGRKKCVKSKKERAQNFGAFKASPIGGQATKDFKKKSEKW